MAVFWKEDFNLIWDIFASWKPVKISMLENILKYFVT